MEYAYSQRSLDQPQLPSNWDMANDPVMLAMMPAAALLFRQGHVSEGAKTIFLSPSAEALNSQPLSPATSPAIRTLTERSRIRVVLPDIKELPWLESNKPGSDATIVQNFNADFSAPSQSNICADTGEICRDWQSGVFTVQTSRSQLAAGWIGGKQINLTNVTLLIDTAHAAVAVQSLDGRPINESERILISMAAQSVLSPQSTKVILSEPLLGQLKLRAMEGLRLLRLTADGAREPLPVGFADGIYTIRLDSSIGSYWLLMEKN